MLPNDTDKSTPQSTAVTDKPAWLELSLGKGAIFYRRRLGLIVWLHCNDIATMICEGVSGIKR